METTEKIVESYCRYVMGWFTIPNIKCEGQHEIDLLAVDTGSSPEPSRYHIECGVSISGSFSKLTDKPFSTEQEGKRVHRASQRRTVGYFDKCKFNPEPVVKELERYGFVRDNYRKVIVTWDAEEGVEVAAKVRGIEIWDFRKLLIEIEKFHQDRKAYYMDDTVRTIQLFSKAKG